MSGQVRKICPCETLVEEPGPHIPECNLSGEQDAWKRGESEGYHRGVGEAARALLKCQQFARFVISRLARHPQTGWPCWECGRKSPDEPLRLVGVAFTEGRERPTEVKHWSGCHTCNNEVLVVEAKKLLEGL